MKMNKLLLAGLLVLPLLVSCSETVYKPSRSFPEYDPLTGETAGGNSGDNSGEPGDDTGDEDEENMTVYFYIDYSHSDEPLYKMRWTMLKPLGTCPEQAKLDDSKAKDPLYSKFLGYSEYPSLMDESGVDGGAKLWDFANDYKQSNILNLYGIWVSK